MLQNAGMRFEREHFMQETGLRDAIKVGLVAGEPLRTEGLRGVFAHPPQQGQPDLVPVVGALDDLLANPTLGYLIVDLNAFSVPRNTLRKINRARPAARLIVIGPDDNEELVIEAILAGARVFVNAKAGPRLIREAIAVALSGSIWAPRRSLANLIDRLLAEREPEPALSATNLTAREREVLNLILLARSNREIAKELGIEERTVKSHVGKMLRKIGAENRIELSMRALSSSAPDEQRTSPDVR
jgi:DNA-binding NarL/FixJ family response regulator